MTRSHFRSLLAAVGLLWCLASCAASRPVSPSEPETPQHSLTLGELPRAEPGAGFDSCAAPAKTLSTRRPTRSLIQRIFSARTQETHSTSAPRKCKNCTFQISNGNNNTQSSTDINKNKAPSATAPQATATDQREAGTAANVEGDGNQLEQTATTQEAAGFGGAIGKPIGLALAGGLVLLLLMFLWKRRNDNQTG